MQTRKAASVLPDPVGAAISVWRPAAISCHPAACGSVGPAGERPSNQGPTAGWNESSTRPRYRRAPTFLSASPPRLSDCGVATAKVRRRPGHEPDHRASVEAPLLQDPGPAAPRRPGCPAGRRLRHDDRDASRELLLRRRGDRHRRRGRRGARHSREGPGSRETYTTAEMAYTITELLGHRDSSRILP